MSDFITVPFIRMEVKVARTADSARVPQAALLTRQAEIPVA